MHVRENTNIMGAGLGDAERRQMPGGRWATFTTTLFLLRPQQGSRRRPSGSILTPEELCELVYCVLAGQMLGEQVCGVDVPPVPSEPQ